MAGEMKFITYCSSDDIEFINILPLNRREAFKNKTNKHIDRSIFYFIGVKAAIRP